MYYSIYFCVSKHLLFILVTYKLFGFLETVVRLREDGKLIDSAAIAATTTTTAPEALLLDSDMFLFMDFKRF